MAHWLEQYAKSQDIIVWNKSRIRPVPKYNSKDHKWDVVVDRNGTSIELHPTHIIIAAGTLGAPRIPDVDGRQEFHGQSFHATEFMGAQPFVGKRVVVVGAGNTAADLCQDLSVRGAASVTMVVRKSTCVTSDKVWNALVDEAFPEGVPTAISDFKKAATPYALVRASLIGLKEARLAHDKDLHDGLRKAGLQLNEGADGSGQPILYYERFGGGFSRRSFVQTWSLTFPARILYALDQLNNICAKTEIDFQGLM
jgi:cation diffusion facilitator CzcD-associated flavoprotein CzcO